MKGKDVPRISDAERAVAVLQRARQPLYYRDLIQQVVREQDGTDAAPAHRLAEIYTQINMDSRFVHLGKGLWGLCAWVPQDNTVPPAENDAASDVACTGGWSGTATDECTAVRENRE